jgi:hypothetical protein
MEKIRQATNIVAGNLTHTEKMELIRILISWIVSIILFFQGTSIQMT